MLYGAVLRPPVLVPAAGRRPAAVQRLPGVTFVHDGDLVACLPRGPVPARRALASAGGQVAGPRPGLGPCLLFAFAPVAGWAGQSRGGASRDVEHALATAEVRLDATYTTPYIAHVRLRPGGPALWRRAGSPFGRHQVPLVYAHTLQAPLVWTRPTCASLSANWGAFGGSTAATWPRSSTPARAVDRPVMVHWSRRRSSPGLTAPDGVVDVRAASPGWQALRVTSATSMRARTLSAPYSVEHRRLRYSRGVACPQGSYGPSARTPTTSPVSPTSTSSLIYWDRPSPSGCSTLMTKGSPTYCARSGTFRLGQMSRPTRPGTDGCRRRAGKRRRVATCAR